MATTNLSDDTKKLDQFLTLMVPAIFFMMTIILDIIVNTPGVSGTFEILFVITNITYTSIMYFLAAIISQKKPSMSEQERLVSFLSYFIIVATAILPSYLMIANYDARHSQNVNFKIVIDYEWHINLLVTSIIMSVLIISKLLWNNVKDGLGSPRNEIRFLIALGLTLQVIAFGFFSIW